MLESGEQPYWAYEEMREDRWQKSTDRSSRSYAGKEYKDTGQWLVRKSAKRTFKDGRDESIFSRW